MVKRKPVASLRECSLKAIPRFRVLTRLIKETQQRDFSSLGFFTEWPYQKTGDIRVPL
jgi:hypothetical protein